MAKKEGIKKITDNFHKRISKRREKDYSTLPEKIKQKLSHGELQFSDLADYPVLRKYIREDSFKGKSKIFVEIFGSKNALKLFDAYQSLILKICSLSIKFDPNIIKEYPRVKSSYKAAEKFLFKSVVSLLPHASFDLKDIPENMVKMFPNDLIEEGELPKDVIERYYKGRITFADLRKYRNVLQNKRVDFCFINRNILRFFSLGLDSNYDGIWDYLDKVPEELDEIVLYYLNNNFSLTTKNWTSYKDVSRFLYEAAEQYFLKHLHPDKIYTIEQYHTFSKYFPLDAFIKDKNERKLINVLGFDNILEFNKKYDYFLNRVIKKYPNITLFNLFAKYIKDLNDSDIDLNDTYGVMERLFHGAKMELDDFSYKNLPDFEKIFPNEFIDENKLKEIAKDNKEMLNLTDYYNNYYHRIKDLLNLIQKYPSLLPLVKDKNFYLDKNSSQFGFSFKKIQIDKDKFWDLTVKYGFAWLYIVDSLSEDEINKFVSTVEENNYDYIDRIIYDKITDDAHLNKHRLENITRLNILNLPESFKEKYNYLYLSEDAPSKLKEKYYKNGGFIPSITLDDLRENPKWIEFLKEKDLRLIINGFDYMYSSCFRKYIRTNGIESFLNICAKYGSYLERIFEDLKLSNFFDENDLEENIKILIEEKFLDGKISYNDDLPDFLKKQYNLLIPDDSSDEIKEMYKNKSLTIEKMASDPKLYAKLIKSVNIPCLFKKNYWWIIPLSFNEESLEEKNIKKLKVIIEYDKLTDDITREHFKKYIIQNENKLDFKKLEDVTKILVHISNGNSLELLSFEEPLIEAVLNTKNPFETLRKIEDIFIKNNLPLFAKIFLSFKIIYPTMKFDDTEIDFSNDDTISPNLTDKHIKLIGRPKDLNEARFNLIFNDLLRIAVHSKNESLVSYLDNIEKGNKLYDELINEKREFLDLTKEEMQILNVFAEHLKVLYKLTKEGKNINIDFDGMNLENKLKFLARRFKPTDKVDLKSRIIRSFAYFSGYKTFDDIKNDTSNFIEKANQKNILTAQKLGNEDFILKEGDMIRGIGNYEAFSNSLSNGNVSNEFLSMILGLSRSDTTPLDVDFGRISKDGTLKSVIPNIVFQTEIMLVIRKDNPNFYVTRDKDGNIFDKYDPKKGDLFKTSMRNHFGIRTGIAISEVDYIIYKNDHYDNLNIVKYELARNGLYIPVIDYNTNKLIFTYDEYKQIRNKMQGLSYYGQKNYTFSPNIKNEDTLAKVENMKNNNDRTKLKKDIYIQHVKHILRKYKIELFTETIGDLSPNKAEFIDIGSTGRGTNVPNSGDFDFILKLDQKVMMDPSLLSNLQKDLRSFYLSYDKKSNAKYGSFRDKGVLIPGLDEPIDIDITFMPRTDKISYSTDECIKDRLETIKSIDEEKYNLVVANIILAKELFKSAGVYKPLRVGFNAEGGLGGVGVETWILTHGGSLIDAARSFLNASENKILGNFQESYPLYDFGENHRAFENDLLNENKYETRFRHNDYIKNLSFDGYDKIKIVLKMYIKNVDLGLSNPFEETLKVINSEKTVKSKSFI